MANRVVEWVIRAKDGFTGVLKSVGSKLAGAVKGAFRMAFDIRSLIAGSAAIATMGAAIKKAFDFETYQTQFKVLLGSITLARDRFREIKDFAAKTPFGMEEIIVASRHLTVFSEKLLGGRDSLTLVGDAAAAVGANIQDVAFWVGRAYSMLKSGKPFGEAAMHLQEMGILTAEGRNQLEALQSSGATFADTWGRLTAELRRFNGGMSELSTTGNGLLSTLKDEWTLSLATWGQAFQDTAKATIHAVIGWLGKLREDGSIERWAKQTLELLYTVAGTAKALKNSGAARSEAWQGIKDVLVGGLKLGGQKAAEVLIAVAPRIGALIGSAAKALMHGFQERDVKQAARELGLGNKLGMFTGAYGGFMGQFSAEERAAISARVYENRRARDMANAGYEKEHNLFPTARDQLDRGLATLAGLGDDFEADVKKYVDAMKAAAEDAKPPAAPEAPAVAPAARGPTEAELERARRAQEAEEARQIRLYERGLRKQMADSEREASAMRDRLSRAQAAAREAWGWYRDPEAFRAQLADEKAESEAQKRFRKDAERLQGKRGWRTAKLNDQDEAVRRVMLAREEEEAAKRALTQIEANTRNLAEKLEELLTMKEGV